MSQTTLSELSLRLHPPLMDSSGCFSIKSNCTFFSEKVLTHSIFLCFLSLVSAFHSGSKLAQDREFQYCRPCCLIGSFNLSHEQFSHNNGNIILVLMHSGIVNGHQLMCDVHTVLEQHMETAALFVLLDNRVSSFSTISICVFVTLTVRI